MKASLTLDESAEQIMKWRESKNRKGTGVPQYCWRHAVRLSKQYTPQIVAAKMKLDLSELESKMKRLPALDNNSLKRTPKKRSFEINSLVELQKPRDLNECLSPSTSEKCILELDLNNGMKLRIFS